MFNTFPVGVARTVMKDVTLSDGTFLPKGTSIISPSHAIHHDESVYPNPNVFDPLRFVKLHLEQPERSFKYQMVAVNPEFLPFGLGKAAWYVILSLCFPSVPPKTPCLDNIAALADFLRPLYSRACLHTSFCRMISRSKTVLRLRNVCNLGTIT